MSIDLYDGYDEDDFEPAVTVAQAAKPIRAKTEPCLIFRDEECQHLREVGDSFTLCGARTAQGLQKDDPRRSWPLCAVCAVAGGEAA